MKIQTIGQVLLEVIRQTFPPIIWIFTEGEGDGIKYRLPFKILSTLSVNNMKKVHKKIKEIKPNERNSLEK